MIGGDKRVETGQAGGGMETDGKWGQVVGSIDGRQVVISGDKLGG